MSTALALWLLATGRWGSYVGREDLGLFVTEVSIGLAALVLVVQMLRGSVDFGRLRRLPPTMVVVALLLVLAIGRLIASEELSRDALRDFAPYGYAIVAFLTFLSPIGRWEKWSLVAFAALVAHATWVGVSHGAPELLEGLPTLGDAPIFALRPDFDATVCGLGIGLCLFWLRYRRPGLLASTALVVLAVAQMALVFLLPSRAGLVAALLSVFLVWWGGRTPSRELNWKRVTARVAVLVVAVPLALLGLSQTSPGKRIVDTIEGRGAAAGTTNARQLVYETTADYVLAEPSRILFGVGFGPDFMHRSGADEFYEGDTYVGVRSPHNYTLGTWARLGVFGALLTLVLTGLAVIAAWRVLRYGRDVHAIDVLAAGATVGLPIAAAMGVILESPFGAVPYFWAIGHLARITISRDSRVATSPAGTDMSTNEPEEPGTSPDQRSTRTSRPASSSSSA